MRCVQWLTSWQVQLGVALTILSASLLLTISTLLRYVPALDSLAIGKTEPFWVLLLSDLALVFAGFSGIPAALAYRELKK